MKQVGEVSRDLSDLAQKGQTTIRIDVIALQALLSRMVNRHYELSNFPNRREMMERSRPNVLDICGIPVMKQ